MRARTSIAGIAIVVSLCVWIPTAAGAAGAAQTSSTQVPVSVGLCQERGWQSLTNVQGQPFSNQGQCISYFIHNPVSLADLTGSFSGITSVTVFGAGCPISQSFDTTYPGSSGVGEVTLNIGGYFGSFVVATNVGTLSGNATGPITSAVPNSCPTCDFALTLTVLSGTGAFAATTGTINVNILWPDGNQGPLFPVTGSVTIP